MQGDCFAAGVEILQPTGSGCAEDCAMDGEDILFLLPPRGETGGSVLQYFWVKNLMTDSESGISSTRLISCPERGLAVGRNLRLTSISCCGDSIFTRGRGFAEGLKNALVVELDLCGLVGCTLVSILGTNLSEILKVPPALLLLLSFVLNGESTSSLVAFFADWSPLLLGVLGAGGVFLGVKLRDKNSIFLWSSQRGDASMLSWGGKSAPCTIPVNGFVALTSVSSGEHKAAGEVISLRLMGKMSFCLCSAVQDGPGFSAALSGSESSHSVPLVSISSSALFANTEEYLGWDSTDSCHRRISGLSPLSVSFRWFFATSPS